MRSENRRGLREVAERGRRMNCSASRTKMRTLNCNGVREREPVKLFITERMDLGESRKTGYQSSRYMYLIESLTFNQRHIAIASTVFCLCNRNREISKRRNSKVMLVRHQLI